MRRSFHVLLSVVLGVGYVMMPGQASSHREAPLVSSDPQAEDQQSPFLGKAVPAFDLPTLTGERVSNQTTEGKTVIIETLGFELKRFYLFPCWGFSGVPPHPPQVRY